MTIEQLNKVAKITLIFWLMKIVATTLGETLGDFLSMLLNGGRYNDKQILGRRTVELMLSPQLADNFLGMTILASGLH